MLFSLKALLGVKTAVLLISVNLLIRFIISVYLKANIIFSLYQSDKKHFDSNSITFVLLCMYILKKKVRCLQKRP